jgi:NADH-quinone oxidoreductase E subunit
MSTQTQQEKAPELSFSDEAEEEFANIISKYPTKRAALIPTLYLAQREFEYLSVPAMEYVAERLELPPSKVLQVATFYTMFKKKPGGRYHIEVCTSVPCCNMGGYEILRHLEEKLGIKAGETTPDKKFTVTEAECLAACGLAPLVQIDSLYYENLTTDILDEIIDELP